MKVTIEDMTSAIRYLGRTRDWLTRVKTVVASMEMRPKEKMLYIELHCPFDSCSIENDPPIRSTGAGDPRWLGVPIHCLDFADKTPWLPLESEILCIFLKKTSNLGAKIGVNPRAPVDRTEL